MDAAAATTTPAAADAATTLATYLNIDMMTNIRFIIKRLWHADRQRDTDRQGGRSPAPPPPLRTQTMQLRPLLVTAPSGAPEMLGCPSLRTCSAAMRAATRNRRTTPTTTPALVGT
eukprot:GHVU01167931.1.p4 GENE.GHVU01167931.1~~GHVU01167931.1.p4  ORF type:complete len:116 (+),score=10.87 GHVU01167931.1:522-869(+)